MRPRSTACWAARYSLDLVRKYPLARSRIFLRRARRLVPRFTRGIALSPFRKPAFAGPVTAAGGKDPLLAERKASSRAGHHKMNFAALWIRPEPRAVSRKFLASRESSA